MYVGIYLMLYAKPGNKHSLLWPLNKQLRNALPPKCMNPSKIKMFAVNSSVLLPSIFRNCVDLRLQVKDRILKNYFKKIS